MSNFTSHLKSYLSDQEIDDLIKSLEQPCKHAALLNLEKMDDETFLSLFPNAIKHPIVQHAYIYDKNEYDLGKSIYHELGCFYLQEPSAMTVSSLLEVNDGDFILDMCAAPGGKTIGVGLKNRKGIIISNDISKERLRALLDNTARLGLANIVITNNDFSKINESYLNTFDKIVLDAPCSGSGMFRKDEKMKDDWSINKVFSNAVIQMDLIYKAYTMLKPGGEMVYSTCSFSYEEDEAVVKHLLSSTDAQLVSIQHPLFFQSKDNIGAHLLPSIFPGEGHYICVIKKPGILTKTKYQNKQNNKLLPKEISSYSTYQYSSTLFALPLDFKYSKLNIYRFGLKVGELFKDKIVYSYELSHALKDYDFTYDLDENQTKKYIEGEELKINSNYKGNILLTYKKIAIDFAKANTDTIKNHYPKYLRKKNVIF